MSIFVKFSTTFKVETVSFGKKSWGKPENYDKVIRQNKRLPAAPRERVGLPLLWGDLSLLLAMPLRVPNLSNVHAGELLGDVVQRHHVAVPGLRRSERLWKSVTIQNILDL
ncbi:MAG: hypothetical protein WB818_04770 [Desulfobacterales bacterium]